MPVILLDGVHARAETDRAGDSFYIRASLACVRLHMTMAALFLARLFSSFLSVSSLAGFAARAGRLHPGIRSAPALITLPLVAGTRPASGAR